MQFPETQTEFAQLLKSDSKESIARKHKARI